MGMGVGFWFGIGIGDLDVLGLSLAILDNPYLICEILVMNLNFQQKTKKMYTGRAIFDMIGAPGERIKKPNLKKYRVFVQSKGMGYRPLISNSLVLYEVIF